MVGEHDPVELVGELLGVDLLPEVALDDGGAHAVGDHVQPVLLRLHEALADGAGLVVQLGGQRHEHAPREAAGPGPLDPAFEQRPHALLPARRGQGRLDHRVHEALDAELEDLELEGFLRFEVRVEAALAHADLGGQVADRQAVQPLHRGQSRGGAQDRGAADLALRGEGFVTLGAGFFR